MEPVHTFQRLIPVDIAGFREADRGPVTVINDLAGALVRAGFKVVNTDPALIGADDAAHIDTETAQVTDAFISNRVLRQDRQERGILIIIGKRNSHIGFTAAEGRFEHRALEEAFQSGGLQTQHNFAES